LTSPIRIISLLGSSRGRVGLLVLAGALSAPSLVRAQTAQSLPVFTAEATPIGALPPLALPMPASRDHNYWGYRLQIGQRRERGPEDLLTVAVGVDYQVAGGSIFGITGGHQWRQNCHPSVNDCSGHNLYGARARFNLMTGGSTIAEIVGDRAATSTLGTEFGFGYAPKVTTGVNACTFDAGVPLSIAMLERIRLVTFVTPGVVWDLDCSSENTPRLRSYLLGFGLGLQQLGFRGLDVHVGAQRIFRGTTGMQYGISVTWVRLP
jgi:hypothetical protein